MKAWEPEDEQKYIEGGEGMSEYKTLRAQALASYLQALAMLEQTSDTYVKREIRQALVEIQRELGLRK